MRDARNRSKGGAHWCQKMRVKLFWHAIYCAKQYICALVVYSVTIFLLKLKIIIDRAIGAPDHGKDVVGGLNARYKRYLRS